MRNIFIALLDDVRQMLNVDHDAVLRLRKAVRGLGKCTKEMVGQGSGHRSSNMVSRVVLSTHACLFFERLEKFMACSVYMSTT